MRGFRVAHLRRPPTTSGSRGRACPSEASGPAGGEVPAAVPTFPFPASAELAGGGAEAAGGGAEAGSPLPWFTQAPGCIPSPPPAPPPALPPAPDDSFFGSAFKPHLNRSERAGGRGEEGELGVRRRRARSGSSVALPPPRPPSPSFLPLLPLLPPLLPPRRPRPEPLLPPHVTRQRAMQITAAAGSHWPRRAHLMAARARRMAAGPRAPPAPRAPPLRAHGLGQAVGSQSRARRPRSQALSARLRSRRCPLPPSPTAPLRAPLGASLPPGTWDRHMPSARGTPRC